MNAIFATVSGFKAQSVRASHRYREVTGSNPVEVPDCSGFCTQLPGISHPQLYIHDACVSYIKETIFFKICNFLHFLSYSKLAQRPTFWDKSFFKVSSLKFDQRTEND